MVWSKTLSEDYKNPDTGRLAACTTFAPRRPLNNMAQAKKKGYLM